MSEYMTDINISVIECKKLKYKVFIFGSWLNVHIYLNYKA